MNRKNAIRIILPVVFIFIAVCYYNSLQINEDMELGNRIQSAVAQSLQQSEAEAVALKELTTFQWDTLYVIKPYNDVKVFCKEYNIGYKMIQYGYNEDSVLLVFVSDNKIVAYVDYKREDGDFAQRNIKEKYSAENAVFRFSRGEDAWISVEDQMGMNKAR